MGKNEVRKIYKQTFDKTFKVKKYENVSFKI